MHANLHRHHRVGIGGGGGSLLLLISVPGSIACTAGDERDGHDTGDQQIAALGRHLAMANLGLACRGTDGRGISPMATVSSTAGAEPRPGSSRVSESSGGKLSSKMVSSPVSDSGWLPASHSDSSCPASTSVGTAPSSLHPDHRAAPRFPAHPAHQRPNRQTQSHRVKSGLSSPRPRRKLLHLGPHPLGPSSHLSYIPKLNIGTTMYPKTGSYRAVRQLEI